MPKKPKQFKKPLEKKDTKKSPSNPRKITEASFHRLKKEWSIILFSFVVGALLMVILFFAYDSLTVIDELEMKRQQRILVKEEINDWEQVVSLYPDYRDGYFKLAMLYYQVGDRQKAKINLDEAMRMDPQFENGRILKEKMGE